MSLLKIILLVIVVLLVIFVCISLINNLSNQQVDESKKCFYKGESTDCKEVEKIYGKMPE